MILAVDIGNSFTNLGLFKGQKLIRKYKFPTIQKQNIETFNRFVSKSPDTISATGISSVVPEVNKTWKQFLKSEIGKVPFFIGSSSKLPINLKVKNKQKLGPDRICNAVAGFEMFERKHNVLIIDFGTATTYDVVLRNGDFPGGIIAPGIETSAQALYLRTSKLPLLTHKRLTFPRAPLGKNTYDALRSGIMFSALDSTEMLVKRLEKFLNVKFKIIITGGLSEIIAPKIPFKFTRRPDLVLTGINYIINYRDEC